MILNSGFSSLDSPARSRFMILNSDVLLADDIVDFAQVPQAASNL